MGNQPSFFVLGAQEHLDEPDHFAYTLNVTSPAPVSQDQRVGGLYPSKCFSPLENPADY